MDEKEPESSFDWNFDQFTARGAEWQRRRRLERERREAKIDSAELKNVTKSQDNTMWMGGPERGEGGIGSSFDIRGIPLSDHTRAGAVQIMTTGTEDGVSADVRHQAREIKDSLKGEDGVIDDEEARRARRRAE